jgi:cysteine desulfurase family protein
LNSPARIYLDNAATSFPKPEEVYQAVDHYQRELGAAVGRGATSSATEVGNKVDSARRQAARLLGVASPERIAFTFNGTDALNTAIHGIMRPGDHVVTTAAEHNSVLRPLRFQQSRNGTMVDIARVDADGRIDVDHFRGLVNPWTRLVIIQHASNVTGVIQPIVELIACAQSVAAFVLVDAAQTAGHLPIDFDRWGVDLLACSGHKGLLGPLGTGLLCIAESVASELQPLREGGTGSQSELDLQPESLPDRFESGNHNAPGLVGLGAALDWIESRTLTALREHELALTQQLLDGLSATTGVTIYGPRDAASRVGVVSFQLAGYDPQDGATILDESFGIEVRAGLHCAPLIHAAIGSKAGGGTIRASVGPFTTAEDITALTDAVKELMAT